MATARGKAVRVNVLRAGTGLTEVAKAVFMEINTGS